MGRIKAGKLSGQYDKDDKGSKFLSFFPLLYFHKAKRSRMYNVELFFFFKVDIEKRQKLQQEELTVVHL